jgi:hypothetical protein
MIQNEHLFSIMFINIKNNLKMIMSSSSSESPKVYMVVNIRVHRISQGACKLGRTLTLIKN